MVKAAANNRRNGKQVMALLLNRQDDKIQITSEAGIMICRKFDSETVKLLLDQRGDQIQVTEDVVKAAASNLRNGKEVMALLLDRRSDKIQITGDVVEAAAGNWRNGKQVMALLLNRQDDKIQITLEAGIMICRKFDLETVKLLLDRQGDQIQITGDVVEAAAGNWRNGKQVMALLLNRQDGQIQITSEAGIMVCRKFDSETVKLLLDRRGDQIQVTEDVIKAVASNEINGSEVMALLLDRQSDQIQITEGVVKAAATNLGNGREVMALLLNRRDDQIQITSNVVRAICELFNSGIVKLLLDRPGHQLQITSKVVIMICEKFDSGVVKLLLDRRGDQIHITEDVVKAAARNSRNGKEVIALLLNRSGGDQIWISEDVYTYLTTHPAYSEFTAGFRNLVQRYHSDPTKLIDRLVHNTIEKNPTTSSHLFRLIVNWDPLGFLRTQYDLRLEQDLGEVITITGQSVNAQLTTVNSYLSQTWSSHTFTLLNAIRKTIAQHNNGHCYSSSYTISSFTLPRVAFCLSLLY